jgi:hypothetical protein
MFWVLAAILTAAAWAAPAAAPKNSRIAVRYGLGHVLIVGGDVYLGDEATANALSRVYDNYPKLSSAPVGEWMNAVPPEFLQSFQPEPRTGWHIGDRWQLYPGAGPPFTVVIEKVVIVGHGGCGCFRDGAVAGFLNPEGANRIAGLRASEFLVVPGNGLPGVSQVPLLPLDREDETEEKIRRALFDRARGLVSDENWALVENPNFIEEEKQRVKDLNRHFMATEKYAVRISAARWALPGRKPLLFVQALWFSHDGGEPLAVFAAESILEEGGDLQILAFDYTEAERMRFPEFAHWPWSVDGLSGFLNAWRIGNRYFVLRRFNGYESHGAGLQELDLKEGLVDTDLGYAF